MFESLFDIVIGLDFLIEYVKVQAFRVSLCKHLWCKNVFVIGHCAVQGGFEGFLIIGNLFNAKAKRSLHTIPCF